MRTEEEILRGDTPGMEWRLKVHRLAGSDPFAPGAYLQAALHGSELPGVAAIHFLLPMLARAEADGRLAGDVTVVPYANPIGAGQHLFGQHLGRFGFGSRVNFNRDFPLLDRPDPSSLPGMDAPVPAERRLKARLLALSLRHEIVLDLHCDDQSPCYLYVPKPLWPALSDLAAALGCVAVIVWDGSSDAAFEEAAVKPHLGDPEIARRAVTTVELRGEADVSPETARRDADGLYRFLVGRGVVRDDGISAPAGWSGPAVPQENVEVVRAPAGGALLYHVAPGDRVAAGDPLVDILVDPGMPGGAVTVRAPQAGTVLTRRAHRLTRLGDDLLKILGSAPSAGARPGALEA